MFHRFHLSFFALLPKLFSSASATKIFACSAKTRHVREARRPAARAPAHEPLLRLPMQSLRADVASLALGVVRAFLDCDRHGLRVLVICIILLGATSLFYFLQSLSWPPSFQCCTWHSGPQ